MNDAVEGNGSGQKATDTCFGADELTILLASLPVTVFCMSADNNFHTHYINDAVTRHLGYTPGEITGDPDFWIPNIHPDDRLMAAADYEILLTEGTCSFEYRLRHKSGGYRWMRGRATICTGKELPLSIAGYFLDVTEEKEREREINDYLKALNQIDGERLPDNGVVSICASCKKVKDLCGNWINIEQYVGESLHIDFSHGICGDCLSRLYGPAVVKKH